MQSTLERVVVVVVLKGQGKNPTTPNKLMDLN